MMKACHVCVSSGRTAFYDEVGVIRDVMQNHLMEMMALVAMETPKDSGNIAEILKSKLNLYRQIQRPKEWSILTGQYASYNSEWMRETENTNLSMTPTFAASLLQVTNARWQGVPFLLMSGKKMEEKASYVRVVFKNNQVCMSPADASCTRLRQLLFYVGGSDYRQPPMVVVSQDLPRPKERPGWKLDRLQLDLSLFGENINDTYQLVPETDDDAYTNLLQAVFDGARHLFIDTDTLLASWDIWSQMLQVTSGVMPRIYQGRDVEPEMLHYEVVDGRGLRYKVEQEVLHVDQPQSQGPRLTHIPPTYRGHRLVAAHTSDLTATLATHILEAAHEAVKARGVFHLALSGGRSPVQLLQSLTSAAMYAFPWMHTHVWLVDERCLPLTHTASNFHMLQRHLLTSIHIPYLQVHPMPVHQVEEPCGQADNGDLLYEAAIRRLVPGAQMDFTLLGLGTDGHTASLFPNQTSLLSADRLVIYTEGGPKDVSSKRMSLTLDLINSSYKVGVLVTGTGKHNIMETLSANMTDVTRYPITGVNPVSGQLTWYVDYDALLGKSYS